MKKIWSKLAEAWCKFAHPAPMWPVNGYYRCPACLRSHRVPWEHHTVARPAAEPVAAAPRPVLVHSNASNVRRPAAA